MRDYEKRTLLNMPEPIPYTQMTQQELDNVLEKHLNYNILIPALIESNFRKDRALEELTKRVEQLEKKAIKKPGRQKQTFYLNGKELTDEDIIYYIDYDFFDSIGKLEKEVGAGKNQLRNRYNKAKQKAKIEREVNKHGNS